MTFTLHFTSMTLVYILVAVIFGLAGALLEVAALGGGVLMAFARINNKPSFWDNFLQRLFYALSIGFILAAIWSILV